jgi:hypothetical protein
MSYACFKRTLARPGGLGHRSLSLSRASVSSVGLERRSRASVSSVGLGLGLSRRAVVVVGRRTVLVVKIFCVMSHFFLVGCRKGGYD